MGIVKRLRLSVPKLFAGLLLISATVIFRLASVNAALLLDRSIQLLDSKPSISTSHTFAFNIQSNNNVGSLVFEYCSNNPFFGTPCTVPAGLDASATTLTSEVGETGFSVDPSTTANRIVLTRPPAITNVGQAQFVFDSIVNPSTVNQPVYVRITLHTTTDGSGPWTDHGAVVFAVTRALDTRAYVPPHLTFCTGITVSMDCTTSDGFYIDLGELSKNAPNTGTSQYSGATNDMAGYFVSLFGITMTAGNNVIPALASPAASTPGTSQFGVNLRNNSNPDAGENPAGSGTATAAPGYSIANTFKFTSGDTLSSVGTVSDFNRFTITYLVNVSPNQAPGIYNATFTYVATASF